jgi:hypothetical protein
MKIRRAAVPILTALAAAFLASAPAEAQSLPPQVRKAIAEQSRTCRPQKVVLEKGFLTRKDVNGDGVPDFVLDYGAFNCGGSFTYFCGSAGCLTQVFASNRGAFVKVFDSTVQKASFMTLRGRPAMVLGLHGSECGKMGAAECGSTLYWNGAKFSPAR